jgi:3'-phosphoadenosine 5'-phosphosulfate sulfotransferase (PAPS reductase)/FAD synthetase
MKERHLLSLSGGKDSAALAVYMLEKYPNLPMEYVFIDSGCELPETYAYLEKIKAILGIKIIEIKPRRNFEYWLKMFNGVLPSPQNRWCSRELKLKPYAKWLKVNCNEVVVYNYVGLRADEDRIGYQSKSNKVLSVFPFLTDGLVLSDVKQILRESGLGLPEYYNWRQRSGCYFCFFQRDNEWRGLRQYHPELFEKACAMEENHSDGRHYTWREKGYLRDLTDGNDLTPLEHPIKRSALITTLSNIALDSNSNDFLRE